MKKLVAIAVLLLIFAYCAVFVLPLTGSSNILQGEQEFVDILTLWHIESFEGGAYSRARWLAQQASAYERMNKGVYVHVHTLTYEQALNKLKNGEAFDLLSLPSGYGYPFLTALTAYIGKDYTRTELSASASIKGVQYAMPYLLGGYLLATRSSNLQEEFKTPAGLLKASFEENFPSNFWGKKKVLTTPLPPLMTGYISPLFNAGESLSCNSITYPTWSFCPSQTQYEAYTAFVRGDYPLLLGTQRDYCRLSNRVNAGSLEQISYTFLGGYSDLIQYIAIGAQCAEKYPYCQAFIEYLTTHAQRAISSLQMFSVDGTRLYDNSELSLFEEALARQLTVPNLFEYKSLDMPN